MDIALCYESVLPSRGGAETYIVDLARRLARDGHAVHLYAARWDPAALPASTHFHRLDVPKGPRFLRPWRFGEACEQALAAAHHDVTVGFDKTWGQDVLYPQGGLHTASRHHNLLKYRSPVVRFAAAAGKLFDPAAHSFARLERKQYLGAKQPVIVVNSRMVRRHFEQFLGIGPESVRVVPSAIDPLRFAADDRLKRRHEERERWGVTPDETVGLFVAMNYRLKGLAPLLRAAALLSRDRPFRLAIVGHPKFARYEKLARRLGIGDRVLFLGHRNDP
jgi:UDP-glucose:(heptosyl)LPS alpha-1,3-glucosyltransferase